MLNPDIQFDRMNLYVMPLGVEGSNVSLGSLDFLGVSQAAIQFAMSSEVIGVETRDAERVSGTGGRGVEHGESATLPGLDLAIMNPPFTRSVGGNLLFGSLPATDRRKLQDELSRRLHRRQASATAGLGAAFVAAASPKLLPGEGRLALVLPATVCTGPSWEQTRQLIETDFTLDLVIASHDPQRWNFSDSTDLSEALLIATRRPVTKNSESDQFGGEESTDDQSVGHRTVFVNLWRNPDKVLDAHRLAQAINSGIPAKFEETGSSLLEVDGTHVGEMMAMLESKSPGQKWSGVQFARADLARSAHRLLEGGELYVPGERRTCTIPVCPLIELGQIGPDRRDVWDGFERTDAVTAYPMVANHNTEQRKGLVVGPDAYLAPLATARPGRRLKSVTQLWQRSGRLLIAERLWLETTRVVAMRSETRVLSNVWWPITTDSIATEKALACWLNSSLGLLAILFQRTSTRGGWVALKKADLQNLQVLDVRQLSDAHVQRLSNLFDRLADHDFERLPGMFDCATRKSLDDGMSEILDLPDLSSLRRLMATEPVVSNKRL